MRRRTEGTDLTARTAGVASVGRTSAALLWVSAVAVTLFALARPHLPLVVLIAVIVYVGALALTITGRTASLAPFSPDFYNAWWYVPIVLGAVLRLGESHLDVQFLWQDPDAERAAFSSALLLTVTGLLLYAVVVRGAWRPIGARGGARGPFVGQAHWRWLGRLSLVAGVLGLVVYTAAAGGLEALLVLSNRRSIGSGLAYVQFAVRWSQLAPLAYLAVGPTHQRTSPGPAVYASLLLSTVLVGALGGRTAVIQGWIMVAVVYHLVWRPIRMRSLGAALVLAAAFSSVFLAVRASTWGDRGPSTSAPELVSALSSSGAEATTGRVALDVFAAVYEEVPTRTDFYKGSTFVSLLVAPVPRSIWPDKPVTDESGIVGRMLLGPLGHGLPPTSAGLYYLNFGIAGIYLGFALTGLIHARLFSALLRSGADWGGVAYAILLVHFRDIGTAAVIDSAMMVLPVMGIVGYRAVSTGHQMVGRRRPRSANGGWQ